MPVPFRQWRNSQEIIGRARFFLPFRTSTSLAATPLPTDILYSVRDDKLYLGDSYFTDAIATPTSKVKAKSTQGTAFPLDLAYIPRPIISSVA